MIFKSISQQNKKLDTSIRVGNSVNWKTTKEPAQKTQTPAMQRKENKHWLVVQIVCRPKHAKEALEAAPSFTCISIKAVRT